MPIIRIVGFTVNTRPTNRLVSKSLQHFCTCDSVYEPLLVHYVFGLYLPDSEQLSLFVCFLFRHAADRAVRLYIGSSAYQHTEPLVHNL